MTLRFRVLLLLLALVVPAVASAQSVVVTAPQGDTLRSATPTFFVQASDFAPGPLTLRFEIAVSPLFTPGTVLLDTTFTSAASVTVAPARPLPELVTIYWRARVTDSRGVQGSSPVAGPRVTPIYLTLVSPRTGAGVTLTTRRPTFVWRSAPVNEPPGPWVYVLQITNLGREIVASVPLRDTTFTPSVNLEANTPYRWSVTASLPGAITTTNVPSPTSFVIIDTTMAVTQSLLYQNFPNPFPTATSTSTCIWFDVVAFTRVELEVMDLRGKHVRRLHPGRDGTRELAAGRYGRGAQSNSECDPDYRWDGTDDDGRVVAPGVYLLRFRAGDYTSMKKILFGGR